MCEIEEKITQLDKKLIKIFKKCVVVEFSLDETFYIFNDKKIKIDIDNFDNDFFYFCYSKQYNTLDISIKIIQFLYDDVYNEKYGKLPEILPDFYKYILNYFSFRYINLSWM